MSARADGSPDHRVAARRTCAVVRVQHFDRSAALTSARRFGYHATDMRPYFSVVLVGFLVVGCSSDDKHGGLPDAPPGSVDARVDAPPDVPDQPLPVALTVMLNGAPQVGVHTYFLNADNTPVATLDTDASGTVTAVMAAGGSVTAIDPFARVLAIRRPGGTAVVVGNNDLRTFVGVKPGDHLTLTQNDQVPISFTLDAPPETGATTYDVKTTCGAGSIPPGGVGSGSGSPGPGGPVNLVDCHGTADILIVASEFNNENNPVLGALFSAGQTLPADGTLSLSGDYKPVSDMTFGFTNLPGGTAHIAHSVVTALGPLAPFETDVDAIDGAATASFTEPTLPGTSGLVQLTVSQDGVHQVLDRAAIGAPYMVDVTGVLLRGLINSPSYNPTTRRLEWTEATTGAGADLSLANITVFRAERQWTWTLAAPYTAGEVTFPVLPADVADWTPTPDDGLNVNELVNAQVPGGYNAVRAHVHDALDDFGFHPAGFDAPTGRVVTVELRIRGEAPRRAAVRAR